MLRSNFERGTTRWAVRRAQWRSMGIREEDLLKPKIAVINSSSTLSSCYIHLDDVSKEVQKAIRGAGGLPFEVRTVAPSDFVTSAGKKAQYLLPTRDLIVNEVEVMVEGAQLDGMVCLSSCDKTTPAHLMAAVRLNIPTVILTCGYQSCGNCGGEIIDIDDVYEAIGAVQCGFKTVDDLEEMTEVAIQSPGVCTGLATANSMHIIAEVLGMSLPGNSPVAAQSRRLTHYAQQCGDRIVSLINENIRPLDIVTSEAIENAISVMLAVGGSVNTVRHLSGIATEANLGINVVKLFEKLSESIPIITNVRPNGPYRIEELEEAGGTLAVMKQLEEKLHLDALSVSGESLGSLINNVSISNEDVIRPLTDPCSSRPGIAILRGNLAPEGSIIKLSAVPPNINEFTGSANIFDNEDAAIEALGNSKIKKGDVVILRGMGPIGGPGTVFAAGFVAALNGAGIAEDVAIVTDGELSGLNRGIVVGQIMPEAAEGGPLAVIKQGETVKIDIDKRCIHFDIDEKELKSRLKTWQPIERDIKPGWLSMYAELVQPISQGAVLGKRR